MGQRGKTGDCDGIVDLGTVGATCDFDGALGNVFKLTSGASNITATPKNLKPGRRYYIDFTQGAAARTLTIGTATVVGGALSPASVAASRTVIGFDCIDSTGPVIASAGGGLVTETQIVQAPTDAELILQGGLDTGPGTGAFSREDTNVNVGKVNTIAVGGINYTAALAITHPDIGDLFRFTAQATPGSPDTVSVNRWEIPTGVFGLNWIFGVGQTLVIQTDTGGSGNLRHQAGSGRFTWGPTGISFFGAPQVALAADIVAITDNSTGAATNAIADVGAAFNQAGLNNIHATLAAKINAIRTVLRNYGLMA